MVSIARSARKRKVSVSEGATALIRRPDRRYLSVLLAFYSLIALPYLVWRSTIINWDVWYGPLVYGAELYGIITTWLFLGITRKIHHPLLPATKFHPTVDIMITTYSEPLSIVEPTIRAALEVRDVHSVLVLDDGDRPEVRRAAKRLGARYYARQTNAHAKAGNLNNGLRHSRAEFVLCLDADHLPLPSIIERMIGYFEDPRLAFVQSPQTYYNQESFLFQPRRRKIWGEQQMFYDVIQVAKNRWNAAFFVGTCAILRRQALDEIGGFATGTATEDIHTSLRLHARGWKSLFVPEVLAHGLEAVNLKEFYKQRRRWAAGSLGLLLRSPDSPLRAKGLSLAQRLNYLSATLAHLQGIQKLFFLVVPLLVLTSLQSPVLINYGWFSLIFFGYISVSLATTAAYARGTYHLFYTEAYSLASFLPHFSGLWGVVKVQKKFAVSNKVAKRRERTWLKAILWTVILVSIAGLVRGLSLLLGWGVPENQSGLVVSSLAFCTWNLLCLGIFVRNVYRYEHRPVAAPIHEFVMLHRQASKPALTGSPTSSGAQRQQRRARKGQQQAGDLHPVEAFP